MTLKSDTGPFAMVPDWLLHVGLSSRAIHLYVVLSRYADRHGAAWPLRTTLAERLNNCTTKSVDRAVAELKAVHAISVQPRKGKGADGQQSNLYTVHRVTPVDTGDDPPVDTSVDTPWTPVSPITITSEREPTTCEQGSLEGKTRKPRPPDPIWDAYAEATHTHPQTDSERGMWAKAFKELREADATPAQVRARIGAWAMKYPNAHLTPIALAKHWGSLGPPDLVQYVAEQEVAHPNSERTVAEIQALKQMLRRIP